MKNSKLGYHPFILLMALVLSGARANGADPSPWIVAHRGASHDAPENTLSAFRLAWDKGADAIEGDFYLSRDGHIVCIHDKDTERTAGVKLNVAESTLAELRVLDVGSWKDPRWASERIPTFMEVLATVPKGKKILIEVKCGPEILPALQLDLSQSGLSPEQTIVIAFDKQVVSETKKQIPGVKSYWLTGYKQDVDTKKWTPTRREVLQTLREIRADGLDTKANLEILSKGFVRQLREAGLEFHAWTVDEVEVARRLWSLGVDSITTNRPAFLRQGLLNAP